MFLLPYHPFLPLGLEANIILLAGASFVVKPAWTYARL
jgi:hypothetical protein